MGIPPLFRGMACAAVGITSVLALAACGGGASAGQTASTGASTQSSHTPSAGATSQSSQTPPVAAPAKLSSPRDALPTEAEANAAIGGSSKLALSANNVPDPAPGTLNTGMGNAAQAKAEGAGPQCLKAAADWDASSSFAYNDGAAETLSTGSLSSVYSLVVLEYADHAAAVKAMAPESAYLFACLPVTTPDMTIEKTASGNGWRTTTRVMGAGRFEVREAAGPCDIDVVSHTTAADADKLVAIVAKKCGGQ